MAEGKTSLRPSIIEFNKIFELCLPIAKTQREAYDLAERRWKNKNGGRKYKNYHSFRKSRIYYWEHIRTHVENVVEKIIIPKALR